MEQTLLLNVTYEPLKVVDWQRAMCLLFQGRVEVLAEHDIEKRAVTFTFKVPSVIRLLRFVKIGRRDREHVPFSRANIFARDGYACQYCGDATKPLDELTYDHVIPASKGGRRTWDNIVTACIDCNRAKDDRTPEQAKMPLLRKPKKPKPSPLMRIGVGIRNAPKSWLDYLYWNIELEA